MDTLIVAPYSLILNESIKAKIISQNVYGDSILSDMGNGGITKLIPDAPLNLQNDDTVTAAEQIKFIYD